MNLRATYGTLLTQQLGMYERMFELLERLSEYDTITTSSTGSNVYTKSRCALQKERLTLQLEKTYSDACQTMAIIEDMSSMCQQIISHPVYMQLIEIHILAEARVNEITAMKNNH